MIKFIMLLAMEVDILNIYKLESLMWNPIKQYNFNNKSSKKSKFCRVYIKPQKGETFFQNLKQIGLNPDNDMIILYKNNLDKNDNTFQKNFNLNIDFIKNNILSIEQENKIYYFLRINNVLFITHCNENYMYIDSIKDREDLLGWKINPSDKFGYRKIKVKGKVIDNFHSGVDLPAKNGTIIKFTHNNGIVKKVKSSGYNGGYGLNVLIDCGNFEIMYAHLSDTNVKKGDVISNGTIIGKVGNTGWSYGAHLHLEFRIKINICHPSTIYADKRKNKKGYIVVDPLNPIFKSIVNNEQLKIINSNIVYTNNIIKNLHVSNSNIELFISEKKEIIKERKNQSKIKETIKKVKNQLEKITEKSMNNKNNQTSQRIKEKPIINLEKKHPIIFQSKLISQKSILKKEKNHISKENNTIKNKFINKVKMKNSKISNIKNSRIKENANTRKILELKKNAW